jgi:hypothetical protein
MSQTKNNSLNFLVLGNSDPKKGNSYKYNYNPKNDEKKNNVYNHHISVAFNNDNKNSDVNIDREEINSEEEEEINEDDNTTIFNNNVPNSYNNNTIHNRKARKNKNITYNQVDTNITINNNNNDNGIFISLQLFIIMLIPSLLLPETIFQRIDPRNIETQHYRKFQRFCCLEIFRWIFLFILILMISLFIISWINPIRSRDIVKLLYDKYYNINNINEESNDLKTIYNNHLLSKKPLKSYVQEEFNFDIKDLSLNIPKIFSKELYNNITIEEYIKITFDHICCCYLPQEDENINNDHLNDKNHKIMCEKSFQDSIIIKNNNNQENKIDNKIIVEDKNKKKLMDDLQKFIQCTPISFQENIHLLVNPININYINYIKDYKCSFLWKLK